MWKEVFYKLSKPVNTVFTTKEYQKRFEYEVLLWLDDVVLDKFLFKSCVEVDRVSVEFGEDCKVPVYSRVVVRTDNRDFGGHERGDVNFYNIAENVRQYFDLVESDEKYIFTANKAYDLVESFRGFGACCYDDSEFWKEVSEKIGVILDEDIDLELFLTCLAKQMKS